MNVPNTLSLFQAPNLAKSYSSFRGYCGRHEEGLMLVAMAASPALIAVPVLGFYFAGADRAVIGEMANTGWSLNYFIGGIGFFVGSISAPLGPREGRRAMPLIGIPMGAILGTALATSIGFFSLGSKCPPIAVGQEGSKHQGVVSARPATAGKTYPCRVAPSVR